jgi:hypothetical protein
LLTSGSAPRCKQKTTGKLSRVRTNLTFASLAIALTFWLAPAELSAEIATDHEIYASYCIGVLTGHKHPMPIPSIPDAKILDAYRKMHRDTDQQIERFAAYLEARGLRGKNRRNDEAAAGVTAAEQRGTSDWLACEGVITRCVRSCNSRNKTMKCEARCLNQDQRCRSAQRCEYPDNLPF